MYLVSHFGHAKVYETSVWTPCFQILAKIMGERHLVVNGNALGHTAIGAGTFVKRIIGLNLLMLTAAKTA